MAKRKPIKRRKRNPNTPTAKENLISAINTSCMSIGKDINETSVQFALNNLDNSDLRKMLGLAEDLSWAITDLKRRPFKYANESVGLKDSGFKFYGEKSGLK